MAEEMITIPKWKFKTIENALRLTHRINNCSTKETAFDREVVKAYDYAKSALEEPSSVPQANELLPHVSDTVCLAPDYLKKNCRFELENKCRYTKPCDHKQTGR